ncbi:hypothetical protein PIB30_054517 [Stylosanthes scabra]|uniref:Uncharacterized protein n=1 Tax=Stylosanthes scabra TaxID=79078 RepID=A0ABU6VJS4_9FABA|nr:hypothetical protein [Stylosanthes scabra]
MDSKGRKRSSSLDSQIGASHKFEQKLDFIITKTNQYNSATRCFQQHIKRTENRYRNRTNFNYGFTLSKKRYGPDRRFPRKDGPSAAGDDASCRYRDPRGGVTTSQPRGRTTQGSHA